MSRRTAVIIGAGPAGLTAAYELLTRTDVKPVVLEMSGEMGGISRTINYKGNRIDIGGHRFFSKSDRVMNWWLSMLPVQQTADGAQVPMWHDSEVAAIAWAIQNIIARRQGSNAAPLDTPEPALPVVESATMAGRKCPECGAHAVIRKDGCDFCTQCGHVGTCG